MGSEDIKGSRLAVQAHTRAYTHTHTALVGDLKGLELDQEDRGCDCIWQDMTRIIDQRRGQNLAWHWLAPRIGVWGTASSSNEAFSSSQIQGGQRHAVSGKHR